MVFMAFGQFRRKGLLTFAEQREGEAITFKRLDTGASVAVHLNVSPVPRDSAQGARLMAVLEDRADDSIRAAFAQAWQDVYAGYCSSLRMIPM